MHVNFVSVIGPVVGLIATIVGGFLGTRMVTPKDHERGALLSRIAEESAALVVSLNPTAPWADLLQNLIQRISAASGLPTSNTQAIENAAAAALVKLGKTPGGK